jgi:hypothetical protein
MYDPITFHAVGLNGDGMMSQMYLAPFWSHTR